jgi:hypothetical protein
MARAMSKLQFVSEKSLTIEKESQNTNVLFNICFTPHPPLFDPVEVILEKKEKEKVRLLQQCLNPITIRTTIKLFQL